MRWVISGAAHWMRLPSNFPQAASGGGYGLSDITDDSRW